MFCKAWQEGISWKDHSDGGPHEASFLKLDCSLIRDKIGWSPKWDIMTAVEKSVEWTKVYRDKGDIRACMEAQIEEFQSC
jgi:CDP-glucose 4,6-dehydratase